MKHLLVIVSLVAILLSACAPAATPLVQSQRVESEAVMEEMPAYAPLPAMDGSAGGMAPEMMPLATAAPSVSDVANAPGAQRIVIRNANLSVVVDDPAASAQSISKMAESMGGFVVSLNTYQTTYSGQEAQQASLVIRVPSAQLNAALEQIKAQAVEVRSESVSGQDVTSDYTDLASRLTNLEAAERELRSIMEEASKTEDVLAVYSQLTYIREQIEVIKGQMKYYEESSALSAISIELIPNIIAQPITNAGWDPLVTAREALDDLLEILRGLTDFLISFSIVCLPFILVIGVPVFLAGRAMWKRYMANKKANTPKG